MALNCLPKKSLITIKFVVVQQRSIDRHKKKRETEELINMNKYASGDDNVIKVCYSIMDEALKANDHSFSIIDEQIKSSIDANDFVEIS